MTLFEIIAPIVVTAIVTYAVFGNPLKFLGVGKYNDKGFKKASSKTIATEIIKGMGIDILSQTPSSKMNEDKKV